ncbi:DUF6370 family protein [Flavobacterium gilvum]|uniref:Glutaminyl-tRNA synthetase n=1 Tax=Flavobacterium gilvum TaxID=1492737 RepID=A0AAC9I281_9FLAO|nr:DUF6370 family protein [Flavobacterium gilvum]AOW09234.1 hypothetical protein EM308_06770 [Flavobacterium gilvum]KFC60103.1 hypothetical protein FEM08_11040 [Flavobacterium gilvum]
MKNLLSVALLLTVFFCNAQEKKESLKPQTVEVACGECQFGMKGKGCNLAIRIDGKTYFVDGTKIDDHGDAHAADGFCETIRKAEVTGTIVDNRFKAITFTLLPKKK